MTSTSRLTSFTTPKSETEPASTPRYRCKRSGEAKPNLLTPSREASAFRSTAFSYPTATRKCRRPLRSRRKRFLVLAAGKGGTRRSASSQVNTGGWSWRSYSAHIQCRGQQGIDRCPSSIHSGPSRITNQHSKNARSRNQVSHDSKHCDSRPNRLEKLSNFFLASPR